MSAQAVTIVSGIALLILFGLVGLYVRRRHGRRPQKPPDSMG